MRTFLFLVVIFGSFTSLEAFGGLPSFAVAQEHKAKARLAVQNRDYKSAALSLTAAAKAHEERGEMEDAKATHLQAGETYALSAIQRASLEGNAWALTAEDYHDAALSYQAAGDQNAMAVSLAAAAKAHVAAENFDRASLTFRNSADAHLGAGNSKNAATALMDSGYAASHAASMHDLFANVQDQNASNCAAAMSFHKAAQVFESRGEHVSASSAYHLASSSHDAVGHADSSQDAYARGEQAYALAMTEETYGRNIAL